MAGSEARTPPLLAAYVVTGVVVMATWTQFDAIGWRTLLPLLVVFAVEHRPEWWHRAVQEMPFARRRWLPGKPDWLSVCLGACICAPLLVHLAATVGEEFPYGGDEGYHFSATRTFARHLVQATPWLALIGVAVAALRLVHSRYSMTLTLAALWVLSLRFGPEMTFARYPAGFYFLASPLNIAGEAMGFANPHVLNHVMNTLSVPVWLFVLRPLFVRAWPDVPALIAGLLLFFQPTVVTYFGGGGLEPWSLIVLLVALEAAVRLPARERWTAVLLAGCAAWLKEPAILFLPLVWGLAMIDWRGWVPVPRRGSVALGVVAATPFVTYYFVRHTLELPRFYAVVSPGDLFAMARVREWLDKIHLQFGDSGMVLLAGLALFAAFGLFLHKQAEGMRAHVACAGFCLALMIFFYVDVQGIPYTGYGRYLMFPYVALVAAALVGGHAMAARNRGLLWATGAIVLALQAAPLARTLSLDWSADYTRNSLEWHRCLIRLPFRELAARIHDDEHGRAVSQIRLVTITLDTQITSVAYPDVAARFSIRPDVANPETTDCRCRADDEAVIAAFEYRTNFDGDVPNDPRVADAQVACVAHLEDTCRRAVFERAPDGQVVAALGVAPAGERAGR